MSRYPALLLTCLALGTTAFPGRGDDLDPASLRRLGETTVERGLTPGLAVAVVQGEHVVWEGGFGTADADHPRPVTPETRFYIASTSKALTGLAAAVEAARGAFSLEAPLSAALPGIRLDPALSADSIRVIDLLTHTHGISPAGPVSFRVAFTGVYTNAEILSLIGLHPAARGGSAFQYSNVGYDLIGILLAPRERDGWKAVVDRDVCVPLGMTHTTAYRSRLADDEIAMPHEMTGAGFARIPLDKQDANMGPAGGHFTTAGDLGRLVVAELNGGRIAGAQAVPAAVIAETQLPLVPQDRTFDGYRRHAWGIGWDLGTFEADTLLHRFGGFAGYFSHVSFMPGHGIGVVVLANGGATSTAAADAVANSVYDRLLGRPDAEARWAASLEDVARRLEEDRAGAVPDPGELERRRRFPLPLDAYVGEFGNEAMGTLRVTREGDGLRAAIGVVTGVVESQDAGANELRFVFFDTGLRGAAIVGEDGRVDAMEVLGQRFTRR